MASYHVNEADFDLPERPFVDKTIHALDAELPSGEKLGVFVHRRAIEGGKGLRALVDENVALNQTRLHAFTVLEDAPADVGGLPGFVLHTRWRHEGTIYCQRQAHVVVGATLMIFAVTAPLAEQAAGDETFESILQTLAWLPG